MAAGVVTIGRRRYAVGLYWENSPGRGRVAQIAKEAAARPGQQADFFAIRPGTKDGRVPQFGLCSGEAWQTAGMPVLSACLAEQVPGSWAGAFRFSEGVAVIIVRDDLIVPDGDLFFAEETEARDRFIQEVGFGGLQATYAPESWSIPGADSIPISLLLSDQAGIKLQRVSLPLKVKLFLGGAVIAFAAVLGVLWYVQKQADDQMRQWEETLAARRSVVSSPFSEETPPEPTYERFWESAPRVMDVIEACRNGLSKIPSGIAGWRLSFLSCNGTSMALSWSRSSGPSLPPSGASVDVSGATASQTIPLDSLAERGAESLKNIEEITNKYLLENWPGSVSRAPDDPLPAPPPGYNGQWNPPPAPWVKRSFTLGVPELPSGLPKYIGSLPGAVMSSMSFSPGGGASAWRVEGVIYENRR